MYNISDNDNSGTAQVFLDTVHTDGLISLADQNYVSVRAEKYQPQEEDFFIRVKSELKSLYPGSDSVTSELRSLYPGSDSVILDWGNSYITWYKRRNSTGGCLPDKQILVEVSIAHPVDKTSHAILSLDYTLGSFYKKHIDFNSIDELCEHFRRKNPYQIIDSLSEALNKYQMFTSNLSNELDIELI